MTEQTIRSKRSEGRALGLLLLATIAYLCGPTSHGWAVTPTLPKLPVIQNVGIIPVQWEGEPGPAKQLVDEAFPAAVHASHKFRVINDELVAELWQDAGGRAELRSQYELQALLGLTMTIRDDLATMTARLTDGGLKSELLETDTVTPDWLANAKPEEVQGRVESLVFRLVNRLPVDVSVTSVQGKFVTLSGGSEQNIEVGDRVDLVRTSIRSLHPANGTWLEFKKQPLGAAQVVDVKTYNCVAKILNQTYDHAIEVGDGARIGALSARVKFARLAAAEGLKDSGNQDTIIVAPLYNGEPPAKAKPKAPAAAAPASAAAPVAGAVAAAEGEPAPAASANAEQPADKPVTPPEDVPQEAAPPPPADGSEPTDNGPGFLEQLTSDVGNQKLVDEINAYAGPYWWRLSGSKLPATSGKFPLYLFNSVGGGITHTLLYKIKTAFGGGVIFGKTSSGSYLGYQGYGRLYWEDALTLGNGFLRGWRAGGLASLSGMAVQDEPFGGGDWIRGGGFGGLFGKFGLPAKVDRYDWFAEFSLLPLTFGRAGFAGKREETQSSFGYIFALGVYQDRPARTIAWGGGLDLGSEVQTLVDSRQARYQTYQLKVLAKLNL